jgi:hypothetical protein
MEKAAHLRRQAGLCVSLSRFSLDPLVAEHLMSLAATFHQGALTAEFAAEHHLGQPELAQSDPPRRIADTYH